eukprot:CAMPEP_0185043430 /NCGR_PEP_ID=MMETSP1103-20130426/42895_1 /TAXON_ID=36769 /ORGANISM="Paraphysomonas bandaiensis, Strain Caron Lab Isolate" /LENGTH=1245 /DNA_ID=CAMNT_0027583601 /DNA_START=9 /DNA_END=3746 /DNA_ORIENTATION=-
MASDIMNFDILKDRLVWLQKQIDSLESRLEISKPFSGDDIAERHYKSVERAQWSSQVKRRLTEVKDIKPTAVILTRCILQFLLPGPMSEKDIRIAVSARCKEEGIKMTGKGLISGTTLDVFSVCNILQAIGVLEEASMTPSSGASKPGPKRASPNISADTDNGNKSTNIDTSAAASAPPSELSEQGSLDAPSVIRSSTPILPLSFSPAAVQTPSTNTTPTNTNNSLVESSQVADCNDTDVPPPVPMSEGYAEVSGVEDSVANSECHMDLEKESTEKNSHMDLEKESTEKNSECHMDLEKESSEKEPAEKETVEKEPSEKMQIENALSQRWEAQLVSFLKDLRKRKTSQPSPSSSSISISSDPVPTSTLPSTTASAVGGISKPVTEYVKKACPLPTIPEDRPAFRTRSRSMSSEEECMETVAKVTATSVQTATSPTLDKSTDELLDKPVVTSEDMKQSKTSTDFPEASSGNDSVETQDAPPKTEEISNSEAPPQACGAVSGSEETIVSFTSGDSVVESSSGACPDGERYGGYDGDEGEGRDTPVSLDTEDASVDTNVSVVIKQDVVSTPNTASSQVNTSSNAVVEGSAPSDNSNTATSKPKKPTVRRFLGSSRGGWGFRSAPGSLDVFVDPAERLSEWSDACYAEAEALELEERLMRYIAGKSGLYLPSEPCRLGTRYLESGYTQDTLRQLSEVIPLSASRSRRSGVKSFHPGDRRLLFTGDSEDPPLTAAMLLERVQWIKSDSKGKRGKTRQDSFSHLSQSLNGGDYSATGVDSRVFFPEMPMSPRASSFGGMSSSSLDTGVTPRRRRSTSYSSTSVQEPLAPASRHVVPPMYLHDSVYAPEGTSESNSVGPHICPTTGRLSMVDLVVHTTPIPWSSIAKEFVVFDPDAPVDSVATQSVSSAAASGSTDTTGKPHHSASHITSADGTKVNSGLRVKIPPQPSNSAVPAVTPLTPGGMNFNGAIGTWVEVTVNESTDSQKRTRPDSDSQSTGADGEPEKRKRGPKPKNSPRVSEEESKKVVSSKHEFRRVSFGDVVAPLFRPVTSTDNMSEDNESSGEEDISDEAVLARHEVTLSRMRDRWATIQELKRSLKRTSGGSFSASSPRALSRDEDDYRPWDRGGNSHLAGRDMEDRVGKRSYSVVSEGDIPQPRKRGRPPKIQHVSHSIPPSASPNEGPVRMTSTGDAVSGLKSNGPSNPQLNGSAVNIATNGSIATDETTKRIVADPVKREGPISSKSKESMQTIPPN